MGILIFKYEPFWQEVSSVSYTQVTVKGCGPLVFSWSGDEHAFVVVIKHLIDFDGNKISYLSGWVCFYSIKNQCQIWTHSPHIVSLTFDWIHQKISDFVNIKTTVMLNSHFHCLFQKEECHMMEVYYFSLKLKHMLIN